MSKGIRYLDEFKQEAVNQVMIHGYSVADVTARLDISTKSLHGWMKTFSKPTKQRKDSAWSCIDHFANITETDALLP